MSTVSKSTPSLAPVWRILVLFAALAVTGIFLHFCPAAHTPTRYFVGAALGLLVVVVVDRHTAEKMLWFLKQLLPLLYRTTYAEDGQLVYHTWRQWMGRPFAQEKVVIAEPLTGGLQDTCAALRRQCLDIRTYGDVVGLLRALTDRWPTHKGHELYLHPQTGQLTLAVRPEGGLAILHIHESDLRRPIDQVVQQLAGPIEMLLQTSAKHRCSASEIKIAPGITGDRVQGKFAVTGPYVEMLLDDGTVYQLSLHALQVMPAQVRDFIDNVVPVLDRASMPPVGIEMPAELRERFKGAEEHRLIGRGEQDGAFMIFTRDAAGILTMFPLQPSELWALSQGTYDRLMALPVTFADGQFVEVKPSKDLLVKRG